MATTLHLTKKANHDQLRNRLCTLSKVFQRFRELGFALPTIDMHKWTNVCRFTAYCPIQNDSFEILTLVGCFLL